METKTKKTRKLKVLCLEDSPQDVEIMRELLTDAGFDLEMDCTDTEKEFISFLRQCSYDIILADFKLPGFDAFAALRWAMEICPNVPFICVSGTIGEEAAVGLLKKGAVDYVLKDRLEKLPSAVQRALDEAKEKELLRQAEERLRDREIELRAVLESTADGILAVDKNGKMIQANKRFADLWQIPQTILESGDDTALLAFVLDQLIEPEQFFKKVHKLYSSTDEDFDTLYFKDGRIYERFSIPLVLSDSNIGRVWSFRDITERKHAEEALQEATQEREKLIRELQSALDNVKTLQGLIPMCSNCKKIRDDKGFWNQVEKYIIEHTDAEFTHGICPECAIILYGDLYEKVLENQNKKNV